MTRILSLSSLVVFVGLVGLVFIPACNTDSETPNAYFGQDGAPGDEGHACRSQNACNDASLVCVDEDADGPLAQTCRPVCTVTEADPCGAGAVCVGFEGGGDDGACLPAAGVDEACTGRCDDGLVCIDDGSGAGTGNCRVACDDATPCANDLTCNGSGFCE